MREKERGRKNEVIGEVVSDKMDKTISVRIYRSLTHKKYGKIIKRTSIFKAHDEKNVAKTGDKVRILEVRALSKTKRWMLSEVLSSSSSSQEGV